MMHGAYSVKLATEMCSSGALIDSRLYQFKLFFPISISTETWMCRPVKDKGNLLPELLLIITLFYYF